VLGNGALPLALLRREVERWYRGQAAAPAVSEAEGGKR
jgi:hypothetical protein